MTVLLSAPVNAEDRAAIIARSVVNAKSADNSRLMHAMAKARRGEPFVVGVIGGSITAGASASKRSNRWGDIVTKWWRHRFPKSNITLVNAGLGGTGSAVGSYRAERQLLRKKPDFVVIEFTINDVQPGLPPVDQTLEGVIRQTLKSANNPAVMLLFMMNKKGVNVQTKHIPCGKHYGTPMIGYRNALYPEIKSRRMAVPTIFKDHVHPNDKGHQWCADLITAYLDNVYANLPVDSKLPKIPAVPAPLLTDRYENASIYLAKEGAKGTIMPTKSPINRGWDKVMKGGKLGGGLWQSNKPGSVLELELGPCVSIGLIYMRRKSGMGSVEVSIDDGALVKKIDGKHTFGSLFVAELGGLEAKPHKVRIKLLQETSDAKGRHKFEIHGLGVAGLRK